MYFFVFFFSSRRRHTRLTCDWSSDVCSSDLYSASHDTLTSRVVDPIRLLLVADHSYLEAWCRSAEGVRLFRLDRIVEAQVLDEPSAPPPPAVQAGPDTSLFDADPSLPSATLLIDRSASWMFD